MPNRDGNGPRSNGNGRNSGNKDGYCVCPLCGYETEHTIGEVCSNKKCLDCDVNLVRK